jgi:hypothetical protein
MGRVRGSDKWPGSAASYGSWASASSRNPTQPIASNVIRI